MKQVIVVSGGSEGLGYEIAKLLAPRHRVVILAPATPKLARAARALRCGYEVCDVSHAGEVRRAVAAVLAKHKRIDALVNNAGIWIEGPLTGNDPAYIKRVLEVNTLGAILLAREVIPHMVRRRRGTIVNVVSQAGLYAKAERSVYTTSKFAITGFTKCLELELKERGVRVVGLYPGFMKTKLFAKLGIKKDMRTAIHPREVAKVARFILESGPEVSFPEVGVKHIRN